MSALIRVSLAFAHGLKAGEPVCLAQCVEPVRASRQQLVRVGLVSDIENNLVARHIKNAVQRYGELDNAQVGGQMAARAGNAVYDEFSKLLTGDLESGIGEAFQVSRVG